VVDRLVEQEKGTALGDEQSQLQAGALAIGKCLRWSKSVVALEKK
jgi:hypothetical protein